MPPNHEISVAKPTRREIFTRPTQAIRIVPEASEKPISTTEILSKLSQSRLSRREILYAAGLGIVTTGAAAVTKIASEKLPFFLKGKNPINAAPQSTSPERTQSLQSSATVDMVQTIENTQFPEAAVPMAHTNKLPGEKSLIQEKIEQLAEEMMNYQTVEDTMKWAPLVDEILKDPRYEIAESERLQYKNLLLGLVFIESEGKPTAKGPILNEETGERAIGLLQLVPEQVLPSLPELKDQTLDFYDPEINLRVGVRWINYLLKHYPNMKLIPGVHNLGMNVMDKLVKAAAIAQGESVEEVQSNFETMGTDGGQTASAYYVTKYHLGPENLFENKEMLRPILEKSSVSEKEVEDTYKYLAAIQIMQKKVA